ncbi:MAG: bifunctional adenosylcobinamide kinase/adenosylcobinamide-phosphate guanylyltransferase [Elusimicrobia bacterium RIFOXYC2_FULL_34_12]|nr:MAG: bifunctional adenosylcobinamide kinase/adenosylcobinamide-phosphate guanylyltransferase [Elusimicrobia bacterium RIFOXYC2_FULL_34_12]OGS39779.1 MAG: bifunctional adenosylcobinamide kinase/adenosylcobinamide-phosphate guanylyltransferase [Elusimicrobia bacterium RIFOXYD2_FULL_34_30]HAM38421.1 bifunctional adenosylcobinamide kinase/adenosylcobinamide-phosphate guanylyltransferase [Elusimicrobiota bacterium]
MGKIIFISGGVRSGKSAFALELAQKSKDVVFIATAGRKEDKEMNKRIEVHQKSRPTHWKTIEETEDIIKHLKALEKADCVIVDCITFLVSNWMFKKLNEEKIIENMQNIIKKLRKVRGKIIMVSNEVGMGVVPPYKLGRDFRDVIGRVNQLIVKNSNEFYFFISGIKWRLK